MLQTLKDKYLNYINYQLKCIFQHLSTPRGDTKFRNAVLLFKDISIISILEIF